MQNTQGIRYVIHFEVSGLHSLSHKLFIFFSLLFCYSIHTVMVENVADDDVEPKPAIIEASGDVKPTVNVKLKVKIPFQAHI